MRRDRQRFSGRRCESGVLTPSAKRAGTRRRVSQRNKVLVRVVTMWSIAALAFVFGIVPLSRCSDGEGASRDVATSMQEAARAQQTFILEI